MPKTEHPTYTEVDFECSPEFTFVDNKYVETGVYRLVRSTWTGKVTGRGRDRKNAELTQEYFVLENRDEVKLALKALVEAL